MKQERLRPWLTRLTQGVIDRLLRHVTWHGSESRSLSRQPGAHFPLVIILGREHYSERRKSYPALRRRDLEKVLRVDLAGEPPTLSVFGPISGERREVSFYRMKRAVIEALPRSVFIIPESVLLSVGLEAENWADVERQQYRYFLFKDGPSQPAGGALAQRDLVALAAGIDPGRIPEEYRGSGELLLRMRRSLPALPALTWWSCRNPLPHGFGLERVAWKPLAVTAGLMLFAYLALSSIYLQSVLAYRSGVLEELEPGIQEGLIADNEARAFEVRRDALIELWSGRSDTQQVWESVTAALRNRAIVSRFDMQERRVSLYGAAPDASEILALIASRPGFADVSFDAPVRSGRGGRQNFTLSFVLADVPDDMENTPVLDNE